MFHFHCDLTKFEATANNFCEELSPYLCDASQFCTKLCAIASGAIALEEPSHAPALARAHAQGQKRKQAEGQVLPNPEKRKCEGFREKRDRLQEEISMHQIGKYMD